MRKIILIAIALIVLTQIAFALNEVTPLLNANSELVSIREGETLHKYAWKISTDVKLDVFVTNKFVGKQNITFITDVDSITFEVTPNNTYDFVILLDGKRIPTQINTHTNKKSSIPPKKSISYVRLDKDKKTGPDVIPFKIGADQRIYIEAKLNNAQLKFIFDTGADVNGITTSLVNKKVQMKMDGETENKGSDGVATVKTSSKNQLEINGLVWNEMEFLSVDWQDEEFDGLIGWTAFENKIIEINYDKKQLILHESIDSIKSIDSDYSKFEMKLLRGLPYFQGSIIVDGKEKTGWFEYDTGSDWSLSLSQKFASDRSLKDVMRKIGRSFSSGSTGVEYEETIVLAPKIRLGDFEMYQVPISIYKVDPKGVQYNDIMGNLLLKRFNAILDFKNYHIYLKPNNFMHTPYLPNLVK